MATIQSRSSKKGRALKPSKLTGDERPLLQGGYVERNGGAASLFVTDGLVVARFPLYGAARIPEGYVPREALLHIERDQATFEADKKEIRVGSTYSRVVKGEVVNGEPRVRYSRAEPVWELKRKRQFPRLAESWPDPPTESASFSLDTVLLRRVALAIGTDTLQVELDLAESGQPRPLIVTAPGGIAAIVEQSRLG